MEETIKVLRHTSKPVEIPQAQREVLALIAELYKLSDNYRAFSEKAWANGDERDVEFWEALCNARQILIEDLNTLQLEYLADGKFKDYADRSK